MQWGVSVTIFTHQSISLSVLFENACGEGVGKAVLDELSSLVFARIGNPRNKHKRIEYRTNKKTPSISIIFHCVRGLSNSASIRLLQKLDFSLGNNRVSSSSLEMSIVLSITQEASPLKKFCTLLAYCQV